jgi:hypothetical protein
VSTIDIRGHLLELAEVKNRVNSTAFFVYFLRQSSTSKSTLTCGFVGELAKFYYQPAPKTSKGKFRLVLPKIINSKSFTDGVYYRP